MAVTFPNVIVSRIRLTEEGIREIQQEKPSPRVRSRLLFHLAIAGGVYLGLKLAEFLR